MSSAIAFVPYGQRLCRFTDVETAATLAAIDYKFPQCVCYEKENEQREVSESLGSSEQETVSD